MVSGRADTYFLDKMKTATGKRRSRLGLLISCLPKLTPRSDTQSSSSPEMAQKTAPAPSGSTALQASPTSPTGTAPTVTTGTTRNSEDSKTSSSRVASTTASTAPSLSPIEQRPPILDYSRLTSSPPKEDDEPCKVPAMPTSPPPPPPTTMRVPTITSIGVTPPDRAQADRSPSPDHPPSMAKPQTSRLQPRHTSPNPQAYGRSVSAQGPVSRQVDANGPRAVSNPLESRTLSLPLSEDSPGPSADKRKRKSWFPGIRSRANSDSGKPKMVHRAWILSSDNQVDYNTAPLVSGEKVPTYCMRPQ